MSEFKNKIAALRRHHEELLNRKNEPLAWGNGIYEKYKNPIITAEHTPLEWRYDFNEQDNPYLMQRIMMNATLNAGAIKWQGKYVVVVRVEGADRKSFFAVAESPNGVDNFRFWPEPITMPDDVVPATNIYDMRLTAHEDGWIYGIFCAERHDDTCPGDLSAATATAAIARTRDSRARASSATWCFTPSLSAASMPSIPVPKTASSTQAAAAASAGHWLMISPMPKSLMRKSSTRATITPSWK